MRGLWGDSVEGRIVTLGGLLLILSFGFALILGMGKHEGTLQVLGGIATQHTIDLPSAGTMADIPPDANTILVKYVDALTIALHTGSATGIRAVSDPECECRLIGNNFEAIYKEANLLGGDYSLKEASVMRRSASQITLKVVIHMSDTTHVVRKTGARQLWEGVDIPAYFTLVSRSQKWSIHSTSVKL
jgi:hypothetical protein